MPRRVGKLRSKISTSEYLAFLSTKHELDPDQFFDAIISAEKNQEAVCGDLFIKCRSKNQDKIVIFISKGPKVVAQFPISKEFFVDQNNPIKSFIATRFASRCSTRRNRQSSSFQIKDLRHGMKQINLKAKVLEIPEPRIVYTRFGNYATVSNILVGDETGKVKLCLWNEQITSITVGDIIQIENASMSTFKGENQLRIGKKGKLSSLEKRVPQLEAHC